MKKINFASDNYTGIDPDILQSIIEANNAGPISAYGNDIYTARAVEKFREHFGEDIDVFFVLNGTGANVTSLSAICHPYQAVVCAETAHIQLDECGAFERFNGAKLLLVPSTNGKITIDKIRCYLHRMGDQHHVQPKVISISQTTEYGTVYSVDEIKMIAEFAHINNMFLHMDGARISNAAAALNVELRQITKDAGVDVLSFGGTKNGLLLGEAVVFFNRELAKNYAFIRKQGMQLASKMRFISAQFSTLLSNYLWKRNASRANKMAAFLADKLAAISGVSISQEVQANAVFVIIPEAFIAKLQERFQFYVWNESLSEVRLMTSFDTTEAEINELIDQVKMMMVSKIQSQNNLTS